MITMVSSTKMRVGSPVLIAVEMKNEDWDRYEQRTFWIVIYHGLKPLKPGETYRGNAEDYDNVSSHSISKFLYEALTEEAQKNNEKYC